MISKKKLVDELLPNFQLVLIGVNLKLEAFKFELNLDVCIVERILVLRIEMVIGATNMRLELMPDIMQERVMGYKDLQLDK